MYIYSYSEISKLVIKLDFYGVNSSLEHISTDRLNVNISSNL